MPLTLGRLFNTSWIVSYNFLCVCVLFWEYVINVFVGILNLSVASFSVKGLWPRIIFAESSDIRDLKAT